MVSKKMISGVAMLVISGICLLGWRYYDIIPQVADNFLLNAEYDLVHWLVEHFVSIPQQALIKIAKLAGLYGVSIETAAVGFWMGVAWAEPLFILLVAALIPFEVAEILHEVSPFKLLLFALNVLIVLFLTRRWLRESAAHKKSLFR